MTDLLFDLSGRRALVTGASRGIGRAVALALAERGARVAVLARSANALREVTQIGGPGVFAIEADLADSASLARGLAEALETLGGLDILVNNAGVDHHAPVEETSLEEWARVQAVDLQAVFQLCRDAGPSLAADGGGKVVNIASVLGTRAVRNNAAYVAAKHGLIGLTRSIALEWARRGVQVNAVAPGFISTQMTASIRDGAGDLIARRTPMGRWGRPEDLVGAVVFLASSASNFVTGETLIVDGGLAAS